MVNLTMAGDMLAKNCSDINMSKKLAGQVQLEMTYLALTTKVHRIFQCKKCAIDVFKVMRNYFQFFLIGNVVNNPEHGSLDWVKICERSSKVITFIDLAGHERYLKTTVFGMTGHAPDFGMLMV